MNSYCTLYVNDKWDFKKFIGILSGLFEANVDEFNSIKVGSFVVDCVLNPDYDRILERIFPDGFLYFKYRLEISFNENVQISVCVSTISKVLIYLWNNHVPAVASADYENMLPENGGYKSLSVPWVNGPGTIIN